MNTFIKPNGGSVAHAPNAIEVEHIVKKYGDFTAVNDVSFTVKEGEIFGLLGPNGAGKSTLIRMMTTLLPITAGVARIGGYDVGVVESGDEYRVRRRIAHADHDGLGLAAMDRFGRELHGDAERCTCADRRERRADDASTHRDLRGCNVVDVPEQIR